MSTAIDEIHETAPTLRAQPTLIPHLLVQRHLTVVVGLDVDAVVSLDAAETFTTTTAIDITTHVIAFQNEHIDRVVGRPRGA